MSGQYKYNAFISYRHDSEDMKIAEHLHDAIERYHIPKSIRESIGLEGQLNVFRDKYDLPVTDSLNDTIGTALRDSEYLIVICSSHLKESVWVGKEIELFLKTHSRKNIFTVLVDGEPYDVIPRSLLSEEVEETTSTGETVIIERDLEPLSADYRNGIKKAKKTELPRLIAGLLGCSYEDLMLRQQKRRNRLVALLGLGIVSVSLIAASYIFWSSSQIRDNYKQAMINKSDYLSEESIRIKEEELNRELAIQLALASVPHNNRIPYNPHAQYSLSNAVDAYQYPYGNLIGTHSFSGDYDEDFDIISSSENGDYLSALSFTDEKKSSLYIWNTDSKVLIAKQELNFDRLMTPKIFFSSSSLWLTCSNSVKTYSLKDGTVKDIFLSSKESLDIIDCRCTDHYLYLLCSNNAVRGPVRWDIYKYDTESAKLVAKFKVDTSYRASGMFNVSPDDQYCCLQLFEDNQEYSHILITDLEKEKTIADKKINLENKAIIKDICFSNDNILISINYTSDFFGITRSPEVPEYNYTEYTHWKEEILSYNIHSGKENWKFSPTGNNGSHEPESFMQIQYRKLKEINSDRYQNVIVAVSKDSVYFLESDTGNLLQKEKLPFKTLTLLGEDSYSKSDNICLYDSTEQKLITLHLDNDETKAYFDTLQVSRKNITNLSGNVNNLENLFICHGDEIVHYKKDKGDKSCILFGTEYDRNSINDSIHFGNYYSFIRNDDSYKEVLYLYDLQNKKLINSISLEKNYNTFIGVIHKKYIILSASIDYYYKYDIDNNTIEEIDVSKELKKYKTLSNILKAKIVDDKLLFLVELYKEKHSELISVTYDLTTDSCVENGKGIVMDYSGTEIYQGIEWNADGGKVLLFFSDGSKWLGDFENGSLNKIDINTDKNTQLVWVDDRIGFYDKNRLIVYDLTGKRQVFNEEKSDIVTFTLNNNHLYYLELNSTIKRISLTTGKKESFMLSGANHYRKLDIHELEPHENNMWIFDDNVIRLLCGKTAFELDYDSLQLIGNVNNVCDYIEPLNYYIIEIYNLNDTHHAFYSYKLGLFKGYTLPELIQKGSDLIDDENLSEKNKKKYGLAK